MPTTPTIELRLLGKLRPMLDRAGLSLDALLVESGIDPALLADPNAVASLNDFATLFETLAARLGDPAFGLHTGFSIPPGATGLLGHIMLSAPTVREMLNVTIEYIGVHLRPIEATLVEADGIACCSWVFPSGFTVPRTQYAAFMVGALVARIRRGAGAAWMPLAVEFDHRQPEAIAEYQRLLGQRLRFDQRRTAVWIDPTAMAAPLPPVLPGLLETVKELGNRKLAEASLDGSIAEQAATVIRKRLAAREPVSLETIADALRLTDRSLQYRLEQVHTSYERLLGEVRRLEAEHYLRDTNLSMTDIADRLGFSEPSVFTRAAQKWFDMAPRAYRRRLRGETEAELPPGPEPHDDA